MTFESYAILGRVETVTISNDQGQSITRDAKIDTGSYSSRISTEIAKELQLPVVDEKTITSVMGEEDRVFVELQFNIAGVEIKTMAGIVDMEDLRNEVAIGRKDIEMVDGLVDVKKDKPADNEAIEPTIEEVPVVEPTLQAVEVEVELPIDSLEDAKTAIQSFESFNKANN